MAIFNKPSFNSVWANTGIKIQPTDAKVSQGWVVEIPPYEFDNWLLNRQDSMLAHINQFGTPVWDNQTEYQANRSYTQGSSTGIIYRAVNTNTNVNPETDTMGNWVIAFQSSGTALLRSENLADVPNKALARTNLGILTTADYDIRYLQKNQNLADVPNKATARSNLDVYGRTETYTRAEVQGFLGTGMISHFAGITAPAGWLAADGSAVSRITYADLFAYIGTLYGLGNGTTTFNLPDMRGEFIRGWDNGRGLDAGRAPRSIQLSENLSHNHTATSVTSGNHIHNVNINTSTGGGHTHYVNDPGHSHGVAASVGNSGNGPGFDSSAETIYGYNQTTISTTGIYLSNGGEHIHNVSGGTFGAGDHTHVINVGQSGGSEARPRNIALLVCIKV